MLSVGTMMKGTRKSMISTTRVHAPFTIAEEAVFVVLSRAAWMLLTSLSLGIYQYNAIPMF